MLTRVQPSFLFFCLIICLIFGSCFKQKQPTEVNLTNAIIANELNSWIQDPKGGEPSATKKIKKLFKTTDSLQIKSFGETPALEDLRKFIEMCEENGGCGSFGCSFAACTNAETFLDEACRISNCGDMVSRLEQLINPTDFNSILINPKHDYRINFTGTENINIREVILIDGLGKTIGTFTKNIESHYSLPNGVGLLDEKIRLKIYYINSSGDNFEMSNPVRFK